MKPIVNAAEVQDLMKGGPPLILMHVLPEDHYARRRLAGACNACIYETAFPEKVRELVAEKTTPIVVYGEGAPSLDSEVAAARLSDAGYSEVADFRGGLKEWAEAGLPTEGSGEQDSSQAKLSGRFSVDTDRSVVRWTGRNLFNHHEGTLRLSSGALTIVGGALAHAEFILDMRSIVCSDLTDSTWNAMLLKHLSTDDFFATDLHPTAVFAADKAEPISGATPGMPNYKINGQLTLRGITKPLSFPAVIAQEDEDHLTGQAMIDLDRTEFGSIYGSGKFFAFLGKHLVSDIIHLHLKIHAMRSA